MGKAGGVRRGATRAGAAIQGMSRADSRIDAYWQGEMPQTLATSPTQTLSHELLQQ